MSEFGINHTPKQIEAEQSLLGAVLTDPRCLDDAPEPLDLFAIEDKLKANGSGPVMPYYLEGLI